MWAPYYLDRALTGRLGTLSGRDIGVHIRCCRTAFALRNCRPCTCRAPGVDLLESELPRGPLIAAAPQRGLACRDQRRHSKTWAALTCTPAPLAAIRPSIRMSPLPVCLPLRSVSMKRGDRPQFLDGARQEHELINTRFRPPCWPSPGVKKQLNRGKSMSLAALPAMELGLVRHCFIKRLHRRRSRIALDKDKRAGVASAAHRGGQRGQTLRRCMFSDPGPARSISLGH